MVAITVLSFSRDREVLFQREFVLRSRGFDVISVQSASKARFEIEMGRCGVLVMCSNATADSIELTNLFKRNCPQGIIIFVVSQLHEAVPNLVDYAVLESAGPEAIVEALRSRGSASKAS